MIVKASNYKNWCTENISPQSWTRICLKCVNELRAEGLNLKDMEHLENDVDLSPSLLAALNAALGQLYEMSVEEDLLIRY